jgi:alcohol dehydrogenase (cytochrome c)
MTRPASAKRRSLLGILAAGTICAAALPYAAAPARADSQGDTGQAIIHADEHPENWLSYGRTYSEQRYSPLDQINRSNVGNLKLAWYYNLDSNRGQEGTPLIVDGIMYATTNWSKMKALDAATGKLLWQYDPKRAQATLPTKAAVTRLTVAPATGTARSIFGTFDGRLIALDAKTGKKAGVGSQHHSCQRRFSRAAALLYG